MNGAPMNPSTWERIEDSLTGRLVYWRRRLADGSYLSVKRVEDGWEWAHRGPEFDLELPGYHKHEHGLTESSISARRAADSSQRGEQL